MYLFYFLAQVNLYRNLTYIKFVAVLGGNFDRNVDLVPKGIFFHVGYIILIKKFNFSRLSL